MLPNNSLRCAICRETVFCSEEFGFDRDTVFPCENCQSKMVDKYKQEILELYRQQIVELKKELRSRNCFKIERVEWDRIISNKQTNQNRYVHSCFSDRKIC